MQSSVVGRFFTSRAAAKRFKKKHRQTYFLMQPTAGGFLLINPKTFLRISQSLKQHR